MRQFMDIMEAAPSNEELIKDFITKVRFVLDNGYDIVRLTGELKANGVDVRPITQEEIDGIRAQEVSGTVLAEGFLKDVGSYILNGITVILGSIASGGGKYIMFAGFGSVETVVGIGLFVGGLFLSILALNDIVSRIQDSLRQNRRRRY